MAESPTPQTRTEYLKDRSVSSQPYRDRAWDYEKEAVAMGNIVLRSLTYLNGGALVAMPAAAALFEVKARSVQTSLVYGAIGFVIGLVLIVAASAFAFFVMARRAEQSALIAEHAGRQVDFDYLLNTGRQLDPIAVEHQQALPVLIASKGRKSDVWRFWAIVATWASLLAFLAGCFFSARGLLQ